MPLRTVQVDACTWRVHGTPTDCVIMAIRKVLDRKPDLVLSGVNAGANMADDVTYSGTIAAAMEGVDTTPMEGFDPAAADEILGLRELGLRSVVLLPLGYRKEEGDWLVNLKKVRRPMEDFVTRID